LSVKLFCLKIKRKTTSVAIATLNTEPITIPAMLPLLNLTIEFTSRVVEVTLVKPLLVGKLPYKGLTTVTTKLAWITCSTDICSPSPAVLLYIIFYKNPQRLLCEPLTYYTAAPLALDRRRGIIKSLVKRVTLTVIIKDQANCSL
jgi:hypothetical protein